jgi:hypothetical protein
MAESKISEVIREKGGMSCSVNSIACRFSFVEKLM